MTNLEYESLNTTISYIDNVERGIDEIVEDLVSEGGVKAKQMLPDLVEGLQWISSILKATTQLHSINYEELNDVYKDLLEAFSNDDTILISDLLEYEIKEKLLNWQEILIEVVDRNEN
ncbi:MAG: hypothetical protein N4A54_11860 [Peptostreptococcaceae bacterium]|jgi:hypothetical protein|nr:hypothetical protein [Peptostreptococcaceae bacterium]